MEITAGRIVDLLGQRHSKDIFVTECKTGSSQYHKGVRRFDAWVMKRSWLSPMITGYEIKVSRSDFLQDKKWREYSPYCNQLFFVTPNGLVDPREIERPAGLIQVTKNGNRLLCKKPADRRAIDDPIDILKYLLMARTKIRPTTFQHTIDLERFGIEHWQAWLQDKQINSAVGSHCRTQIAERVEKKCQEIIAENKRMRNILFRKGWDKDSNKR